MKSNLKINSNVFLRKLELSLAEDTDFLPHVRGVKAIRKLLWKAYEISSKSYPDDSEILHLLEQNKLSKMQWNTLKWGVFCHLCHTIPIGQTFEGKIQFRCDRKDCP